MAGSVLTALIVGLDIAVSSLTRLLAPEGISVGILVRTVILIAVLFFLPSAALGMVSPVMAKYAIQEAGGVGRAVGAIYAVGSLGSIGGTFLAGYLLIPVFGLTANILTVGIVLATLSLLMGGRRILSTAWLVVLLVLLLTGAPRGLWKSRFRGHGSCSRQTLHIHTSRSWTGRRWKSKKNRRNARSG
jgi:hypothetical protein